MADSQLPPRDDARNDSFAAWALAHLIIDGSGELDTTIAHLHYCTFCELKGFAPLGEADFRLALAELVESQGCLAAPDFVQARWR